MSLPERLERPRCPACAFDLDQKTDGAPAIGAAPAREAVYSCAFCARDWLEATDGVWFADGNTSDTDGWGKVER